MSTLIALLLTAATLVMIIGLLVKIKQYHSTPAPLKIPVTPAPKSTGGVVIRLAKEVIFFAALFRSNKWTWLFGWMFHIALALAFLRHLRYVIDPEGMLGFMWPLINLEIVQSFGKYAGFAMVAGLLGLFGRRIFVQTCTLYIFSFRLPDADPVYVHCIQWFDNEFCISR